MDHGREASIVSGTGKIEIGRATGLVTTAYRCLGLQVPVMRPRCDFRHSTRSVAPSLTTAIHLDLVHLRCHPHHDLVPILLHHNSLTLDRQAHTLPQRIRSDPATQATADLWTDAICTTIHMSRGKLRRPFDLSTTTSHKDTPPHQLVNTIIQVTVDNRHITMAINNIIQLHSLIEPNIIPATPILRDGKKKNDPLVLGNRAVWPISCLNRSDESECISGNVDAELTIRSINTGFVGLRQVVPSASITDSKAVILRKAAAHIKQLEAMLSNRQKGGRISSPEKGGRRTSSPEKGVSRYNDVSDDAEESTISSSSETRDVKMERDGSEDNEWRPSTRN